MTSKILAANAPGRQRSRRIKWGIRILVPVVLVGAMIYFFGGDEGAQLSEGTTFTVTRGPLEIVVLEGGSIESEESEEIKSEVEGQTKILTLVEEGITVTPEDVSAGKVLVELDSKELQDKLVEEKLQYQNALATFTEAKEQYGIQVNQNESDIKAAELEVKFARMDLEKYLGVQLAQEVVGQIQSRPVAVTTPVEAGSEAERVQAATAPPQPEGAVPVPDTVAKVAPEPGQDAPASPIEVESTFISRPEIDFTQYAD
ncbi:MAG: hypothetical protein HYV26_03125, partial [Candidatus Hydrogenedentes bacterium]|nr:hypothetical protein [Candidatus Hydrogenedentota bacterium]